MGVRVPRAGAGLIVRAEVRGHVLPGGDGEVQVVLVAEVLVAVKLKVKLRSGSGGACCRVWVRGNNMRRLAVRLAVTNNLRPDARQVDPSIQVGVVQRLEHRVMGR